MDEDIQKIIIKKEKLCKIKDECDKEHLKLKQKDFDNSIIDEDKEIEKTQE